MGLEPLNEGLFKKGGKFKDLIKKIFNRGDSAEQVVQEVNPYEVKYGKKTGNSMVEGIRLNSRSNEQINNSEANSQNIFCSVGIITDEPQPLPSDNSKKSSNIAYHVVYQNTQGSNITEYYEYFKSLYFIDGQQTDELSQIRIHQDFTCVTNTLQDKTGGCELSQDMRDKILQSFQSHKDFFQLESYLDKVR